MLTIVWGEPETPWVPPAKPVTTGVYDTLTPRHLRSGRWPSKTIRERFESKVKPEPNSGCLLWVGATDPNGYGRMSLFIEGKTRSRLVHRVAWEMANGPIPSGWCVCHKCDTPPCVNLEHLFLGTPRENTRDMLEKGRDRANPPKGEAHPLSKLTVEAVQEMRRDPSSKTIHEWAQQFGVSTSTAQSALKGKSWRTVT